jgi:PAS domain S-box-containing protein
MSRESRRKAERPPDRLVSVLSPLGPTTTPQTEHDWQEHATLDLRVDNRTDELFIANEQLKREIALRRQIEEELRETQERVRLLYEASRVREHLYHSFLTASPDAVVIYDEHGKTRYVSPSFTRVFGWDPEEVKGCRIPYVPDSELHVTGLLIDRVWTGGLTLSGIESTRYTKDGRVLTVSMSASRYHDEAGLPVGIMVILRDVTERKRIEQALSASEERFRLLADVSPFGLAVLAADETVEYLNPKFSEIFGYTTEDIPNLESWFRKAYPDGDRWKQITALWREETAEIDITDSIAAETNPRHLFLCCKNGEQRVVDFRAVVLADGRLIATFLDITAEAKAKTELLRANDEWERTFHAVSDLIFILDDKRRIVRMNRALGERLGVAQAEVAGLPCHEPIVDNKTLASFCPDLPTRTDGHDHRLEIVDESLGGVFDLRISPLRDQDGRVSGWVHAARDLTAFKSLERARRLAVHHLAHELNTPMAVIQASLKRLVDASAPMCEQQQRIERVTRNLQRLKEIQKAVADIVAPPRYTPRAFSVNASVETIVREMGMQSAHRSTVLTTCVNFSECDTLDPDIFSDALQALVKNAIENTPDEGEITIRFSESDEGLLLEVEDTGVGIPPRDEAFIFDAFHHTQNTATYSTKQPFDFNAGGKGLELMRLRMLSESSFFTIGFRSRRCCHLLSPGDNCPGRVSACAHVSCPEDCRGAGGTTFTVLFRPTAGLAMDSVSRS